MRGRGTVLATVDEGNEVCTDNSLSYLHITPNTRNFLKIKTKFYKKAVRAIQMAIPSSVRRSPATFPSGEGYPINQNLRKKKEKPVGLPSFKKTLFIYL